MPPMGMFSCCSAAPAVRDDAQPHVKEQEEAAVNGHGHTVIQCLGCSAPGQACCLVRRVQKRWWSINPSTSQTRPVMPRHLLNY